MENKIFDAILGPQASIEELALDWLADYKEEPNKAVSEVINFLLKSCGCEIPVQPHDIHHPDSAAETFSPIEEKAKDHAGLEYAIVSKKVGKFRHSFEQFFMSIVENSAEDGILYYDDDEERENIIFTLIKWLSPMSSAHLRPFRHTATVAVLCMMTQLCELYKARVGEVIKLQLEKDNLSSNDGKKKGSKKMNATDKRKLANAIETLNEKIQVENEKASKISDAIQAAKASVWQNRNRDVEPRIRVDCVKYLAKWIIIVPELFVDASSLKCFGSGLSDLDSSVRSNVLSVLVSLFNSIVKESETETGAKGSFTQFVIRYGDRIRQISQFDVEKGVRKSAVALLTILNKLEILEADEEDANEEVLSNLIFDADEKVRKEAADYFVGVVSRAIDNLEINEKELVKIQRAMTEVKPSWIIFKNIALQFQTILDNPDGGNEFEDEDNNHKLALISNKKFESLPSRVALAASSVADIIHRRAKHSVDLSWEELVEQLLYDTSSVEIPKIKGIDERTVYSYVEASSIDDPELSLIALDVLYGFISSAVSLESDTKLTRKRGKGEVADPQQSIDNLNSTLIEALPQLLDKYSFSDTAVAKILRLNSLIDIESGYVKLHKESAYTDIIDSAIKSFKNSSSEEILKETEILFKTACQESSSFSNEVKPKLTEIVEDMAFEIRSSVSEVPLINKDISERLAKIERLAPIIDIQDTIESEVQLSNNESDTLGRILVEQSLEFQTNQNVDNEEKHDWSLVIKNIVKILRHYCISKFASLLSPTTGIISDDTQEHDLDFILYVMQSLEKLSVLPNTLALDEYEDIPEFTNISSELRIVLQIALLDIIISGWSATLRAELAGTSSYLFTNLPQKVSDRIIKQTMCMFLLLEQKYLDLVDEPRVNNPNLDALVAYDISEITDLDLSELQIEYLLCEVASRILIAASAGLWVKGPDYVKRLSCNKASMSNRYVGLIRDISRQLPAPPDDEEPEQVQEDIELDIENDNEQPQEKEFNDDIPSEEMIID